MAAAETSFSINGTCSVEEQTHNIDHSSDLLQFANESRQDGCFNDIIVRVGEKNIPANKMVLSCYSKYFNTMFNTEMVEKYKDVVEVHGVDAESVEKLVDFMYTGKININTKNVCDLLAVSDFLQMPSVRKLCIEYLLTTVSPQNCFTIQALADRFTIPKLTEKFNNFVLENYQQVVSGDQVKKLSKNYVIKLLQLTHDKVSSDLVYTTVMNWVKFDLSSNESYLSEVIKFVDFYKLSSNMLKDVVSVEVNAFAFFSPLSVMTNKFILKLLFSPSSEKLVIWLIHYLMLCQSKVNTFYYLGIFLITLGGANSLTKVTKLDLQTKQWSQLPEKIASMNDKRLGFGAAVLNGHLYSLGGRHGQQYLSSVACYDPISDEWKDVAPMQTQRGWFAAVVLNNAIYAIGGYDGKRRLKSVEKYNVDDDTWVYVGNMNIERDLHAACVAQNKIYVVGGLDSKNALKSIECYDDQTDKW
uniref:BTB domain-containing protein n=1 Tax=Ciona intestinalis TaxID=7719 RepID=F7B7P7_CIOIN